jgi:Leucine-rich repeat (LRR) protein
MKAPNRTPPPTRPAPVPRSSPAGNPLAPLPSSGLRACPALRILDLSGAPTATVASLPPSFLAAAPRLEALLLTGCRLADAPWEALRGAAGSLRRLNLAGNSLTAVPAAIREFKR